jgi:hypothetical protein
VRVHANVDGVFCRVNTFLREVTFQPQHILTQRSGHYDWAWHTLANSEIVRQVWRELVVAPAQAEQPDTPFHSRSSHSRLRVHHIGHYFAPDTVNCSRGAGCGEQRWTASGDEGQCGKRVCQGITDQQAISGWQGLVGTTTGSAGASGRGSRGQRRTAKATRAPRNGGCIQIEANR